MTRPLIIIGASARAAAASALRAGYQPWCVDLFADRDLQALAPVRRCPPQRYPLGLLEALDDAPDAPVLCSGALENYPELLDAVAARRPLLGCAAGAMQRVRHPDVLASVTGVPRLRRCRTVTSAALVGKLRRLVIRYTAGQKYLLKPRRGAGGIGIGFARDGQHWLGSQHYLQQYVKGLPLSAVFATDGWSVTLLGATEQIIGDAGFGASGYRYAGSLGPVPLSVEWRAALAHVGVTLAQRCDLRGVFGVDLVLDPAGDLWPVEVNPRYVASIEVLERATGVAALSDWPIPPPSRQAPDEQAAGEYPVHGKAILFARTPGPAPDLYDLFGRDEIADVPAPGEPIQAGHPVCTVFASGADRDTCLTRLRGLAARLYTRWPS